MVRRFHIAIENNNTFFIYCWINKYTSTKFCSKELYMSNNASTDWKMYLCEVRGDNLLKNPIVIGGPGMSVEIDESSFSKRKYNRGRIVQNQWVFSGIYEKPGNVSCMPCLIEKRDNRAMYQAWAYNLFGQMEIIRQYYTFRRIWSRALHRESFREFRWTRYWSSYSKHWKFVEVRKYEKQPE